MAYASWSVVAGEQPSAAKWNILGTNDAFFEDFILGTNGVHAAWTSFTPSWTNLTVGNGTNTGSYVKYGTTVFAKTLMTFGSTSAMGTNPTLTLPVNASSNSVNTTAILGLVNIEDSGTNNYQGVVRWASTTTANALNNAVSGSNLSYTTITSGIPMTWTTNDKLQLSIRYEAAS